MDKMSARFMDLKYNKDDPKYSKDRVHVNDAYPFERNPDGSVPFAFTKLQ